jgi:hypothetical protein
MKDLINLINPVRRFRWALVAAVAALVGSVYAAPTGKTPPRDLTKRPPAANADASKEYQVLCRGPFMVRGGKSGYVNAERGVDNAGQWGENLRPGECGLATERWPSNVNPEIAFYKSTDVNGASLLAVCGLNSKCVLQASVRHDGRSAWTTKSAYGSVFRIWKYGKSY